jgi:outer membrane protein TolC
MHADKALVALLAAFCMTPASASAQQALDDFIASADQHGIDVRTAQAALDTARSQTDEARARLLPSASAQGTYQRNEFQVQLMISADRTATIQLYDQLSAAFVLNVPILDTSAWAGFFAAEQSADAAEERRDGTLDDVHAAVVSVWHQLVAARAMRAAAERNRDVATASRDAMRARFEAQVASQLELSRAEAEVQRAIQMYEEANLQVVLVERNLLNLTGLAPTSVEASLDDDLHEEAPLNTFMERAEDSPVVRAARHSVRAAELSVDAAWLALLPTVAGTAREQVTNAAGFGPNAQWALLLTGTWQLDFLRPAQIGTRHQQLAGARAQQDLAEQQAESRIFEQWHRVQSLRAAAAAARAARDALARAASDAHLRFDAGSATQLEVIQADRDLFQADVQRIQADANLRVARTTLRIRAGLDQE